MARRNPRVKVCELALADFLEGALGVRLAGVADLSSGKANTSLRVELAAGGALLVRFVSAGGEAAEREAAVLEWVRSLGLPVPSVLARGEVDGVACLVQRFVEGVELGTLDEAGRLRAVGALAAALARLHGESFAGSGMLVPKAGGTLDVRPWDFGAADDADPLGAFLRAALAGRAGERLGEAWRARCSEVLQRHAAGLAHLPRAVHGDMNLSNTLFSPDGSELRALLDWEWCHAGDPASDLGNLFRARDGGLSGACAERFAEVYRDAGGALADDWRARARLVDLSSQLEFLSREDPGLARELGVDRILRATVVDLEGRSPLPPSPTIRLPHASAERALSSTPTKASSS